MIALVLTLLLQEDPLDKASQATARVVEKLRPSVVSVSVSSTIRADIEFFRARGEAKPARKARLREGSYRVESGGSGVVFADGYVITNAHVIEGAVEATVYHDDESWDAEIVGVDRLTDLAVLRVQGMKIAPAPLGDSDKAKVGEWVVALGDPFIFERSITFGVLSAKGRVDVGLALYEDFLQVDCAINPGNSGGLLANMKGEVIGINTGYYSDGPDFAGVGLSIPINLVREIAQKLIQSGRVRHGSFNVKIQEFDGVIVTDSENLSFAAGDRLVAINGKTLARLCDYYRAVGRLEPGTKAKVKRSRGGKEEELELVVGEEPAPDFGSDSHSDPSIGLAVQELTPWLAKELGLKGERGVIVSRVDPELTPDLRVGDVIQRVGGRAVSTVKEFREAEGDYYVLTRGRHLFVAPPK